MAKLNIALIGAGRRGSRAHLPVITKMTDVFELVAICDKDEATAKKFADQHGCRAYTSVRDLVKKEQVDIADVVVPADAHHSIGCFLMEHGIHVLCETPLAITLPLCDLMIETAKKNKVKLEVAENVPRFPRERLKQMVIEKGIIGKVARIYHIFYEGGYHGMAVIRKRAGAEPVSILGVHQETDIVPITDRMKRHHTSEKWSMGIIDFEGGVLAVTVYSNVIHARSLGRGQGGVSQVDGSQGTIVGDEVYLVLKEELDSGAQAKAFTPQRIVAERDDGQVLERIELALPEGSIVWENPYTRYPFAGDDQIAVCDELMSLAHAVLEDREPDYGAHQGRLDQEMNIAMLESGLRNREPIRFHLTRLTKHEEQMHEKFKEQYGCDPFDVERLLDVFFPRV